MSSWREITKKCQRSHSRPAFTLVEALVDFTIIAIVVLVILSTYSASLKALALARAKITAVSLANEKMEELRNMPYDDLATEYGPIYPSGDIPDVESISRGGNNFTINTVIAYVDDSFDGTIDGNPTDLYSYDYKKIEVTVIKANDNSGRYLTRLSSLVAAKAAESAGNTGILKICVINSKSEPVPGTSVRITNNNFVPPVNMLVTTANNGCILVPSLPPDSHNHYHIEATKPGFSTAKTYPRTAQNPNALIPDLDIVVQQVTVQTLAIDTLGTVVINIKDEGGLPVANASIHVRGEKEIYFNPATSKYNGDFITDSNGIVRLENMEFDRYFVTVDGWLVESTSPSQPSELKAGETLNINVKVTHNSDKPRITLVEPLSGRNDIIVPITITGYEFDNNATVKLVNSQGEEIVGLITDYEHSGQGDTIVANFDLTGATLGLWNVVVNDDEGFMTIQENGFEIKAGQD